MRFYFFAQQMASTKLLVLLLLHFGFGWSSHKHLHEDHYNGQQHNPEHDMSVLLGDEVTSVSLFIFLTLFSPVCCHSSFTNLHIVILQNTEEIKKLSPADLRIKMMDIIKKIDTNGDNLLSEGNFGWSLSHLSLDKRHSRQIASQSQD